MTQFVKILITLEPNGIVSQILHTNLFQYCSATGMQKSDQGLLSIILAGRGLLVKMLISLEPHDICINIFPYKLNAPKMEQKDVFVIRLISGYKMKKREIKFTLGVFYDRVHTIKLQKCNLI